MGLRGIVSKGPPWSCALKPCLGWKGILPSGAERVNAPGRSLISWGSPAPNEALLVPKPLSELRFFGKKGEKATGVNEEDTAAKPGGVGLELLKEAEEGLARVDRV